MRLHLQMMAVALAALVAASIAASGWGPFIPSP
jgi:hypothetical protein